MPILSWLPEGIKDELGWSVEDAAEQELSQTRRKGYNPTRGTDGSVNRGFWEGIGDGILGNKTADIEARARELYVEKLKRNNPSYRDLNSQLESAGQDERITFSPTTLQEDLTTQTNRIERSLPVIQGIKSKDGDTSGYTTKTDLGTLSGALETATTAKANKDLVENPITQRNESRYIDAQNLQSMMLGHQMQQSNNQFALQQSQLQLQNRREDAREARSERKDRQMMIMQMMKGLSQMGASIAI